MQVSLDLLSPANSSTRSKLIFFLLSCVFLFFLLHFDCQKYGLVAVYFERIPLGRELLIRGLLTRSRTLKS